MFVFLFSPRMFSEVPRSIALKLCHMISNWLNFIIQVQKFRGCPPKNSEAKNMQNFGQFCTTSDFDREYLRDEAPYPKSENATIYGNSSCVWWKKPAELWSTNYLKLHVSLGCISILRSSIPRRSIPRSSFQRSSLQQAYNVLKNRRSL